MTKLGALLLITSVAITACGTKNYAEPYTVDTDDEVARKALNAGDFDEAIAIYEELLADEPERYDRYPLLSAAYAGKAGLNILDIASAQFSSGGGSSIFDQMDSFLPSEASAESLDAIKDAVDVLKIMPEEHRVEGGPYTYSASAAYQLTLYLAANSAMLVKQFKAPENLQNLTEDDAEAILNNLDDILAYGVDNPGMNGAVSQTLEAINQQAGATTKEKLQNYLGQQQ